MGLFDKFKKNEKVSAAPEISDEALVLKLLSEKYDNCELRDDSVYFSEFGVTLRVSVGQVTENGNNCSVQLIFTLSHALFEDELIESCAGLGSSRRDAISMGVETFCAGVLTFVFCALGCEDSTEIETEVFGKRSVFRVPCTRGVFHLGEKYLEKTDFWSLLADVIPEYLGRKRVYYIKLFTSWMGTELICETRINGVVYPSLEEKLRERIGTPDPNVKFGMDKQFIVLIQSDETYEPCPYTREQVQQLTAEALEKMYTINSQESYDKVMEEIISSCPVRSLGHDLARMIPEIYCAMVFGIRDGDTITIHNADTNSGTVVRKSQMRSFGYIEEAVFRCISAKKVTQEQHMGVLGGSARFSAMNQAANAGSNIDDLTFTDLCFVVSDGYELW